MHNGGRLSAVDWTKDKALTGGLLCNSSKVLFNVCESNNERITFYSVSLSKCISSGQKGKNCLEVAGGKDVEVFL